MSEDIINKFDELIRTLSLGKPTLWTTRHIAAYLALGESTVMQKITCAPDFHKPLNVTGEAKGRRWKPDEVQAWADKRREVLPRSRKAA